MNNAPPFYTDPSYLPPPPPPPGSGPAPSMPYVMSPPQYPPVLSSMGGLGMPQEPSAVRPPPHLGQPVVCTNCAVTGHLRRNCPLITCMGCGGTGHFKQDCPTSSAANASPDATRRVRSREERDHRQPSGPGNNEGMDEEGESDLRWSVCRNCGSSRHIQAQCPSRYQSLECYQCHKRGHLMSSCPLTRCYNCGTYGHSSQVCHSMPHCFHCANVGHRSTECPSKLKGRVCYQCNEPGHEAAQCPQGQLCRMCRQPGHLVAHCPQVTCYQCHEKGHTAGACEQDLCEHCGGRHNPLACARVEETSIAGFYRTSSESSVELERATPTSASPPVAMDPASLPATGTGSASANASGSAATTTTPTDQEEVRDDGANSEGTPSTVPGGAANASSLGVAASVHSARSGTATGVAWPALMPPYTPTGISRGKSRVAVVIDGPYFERCVRRDGVAYGTESFYRHIASAVRNTLDFIGDIFEKMPIGYWFDTDPAAFTEFVETAMPLAHREHAFRESALRRRFLTGEMNSGRSLHNILPRLVGTMKKQRGYTQDGPGHVWVQSGVDVALATTLVELFHDRRQFEQVVLLSGDSDVYPAVHYCNSQRLTHPDFKTSHPVRVCGTASSLARQYGQHQDLYDFLPPILLNQPSHNEGDKSIDFPPYSAFR